jgi:hypothetical protein
VPFQYRWAYRPVGSGAQRAAGSGGRAGVGGLAGDVGVVAAAATAPPAAADHVGRSRAAIHSISPPPLPAALLLVDAACVGDAEAAPNPS